MSNPTFKIDLTQPPAELAEEIDLSRISLGGPIFDLEKLSWLNGQYLRAMQPEQFAQAVGEWMLNGDRLAALIPLVQERTERLSDLAPQVAYLLGARADLTAEAFEGMKVDREQCVLILDHTLRTLDGIRQWERDALFQACKQLSEFLELKLRDFLQPLFYAVSGQGVSLPLFDSMVFLGSDVTRMRLRDALGVMGVSKKAAKRLEKNYAAYLASQSE